MRARISLLLTGFVLGIAATVMVQRVRQPNTPTPAVPPPEVTVERAQLKQQLAEANQVIKRLEAEVSTLATSVPPATAAATAPAVAQSETETPPAESGAQASSPFAKMFGGSDSNRAAAFGNIMKAAMQQQVDIKVAGMKARLHLTDEQEQSVREILEKQFGAATEMTSKMFSGKATKDDMAKAAEANANLDPKQQLQQVLSPEQWAEYQKYQDEEHKTQAQMVANVELGQVQGMLQLTEQQQDQVFKVLYDQATEQISEQQGVNKFTGDWQQVLEKQYQSKKDALRPLLTAEQMAQYEKFLDSQRNMIKAFMPAMENSGTTTSGNSATTPSSSSP